MNDILADVLYALELTFGENKARVIFDKLLLFIK